MLEYKLTNLLGTSWNAADSLYQLVLFVPRNANSNVFLVRAQKYNTIETTLSIAFLSWFSNIGIGNKWKLDALSPHWKQTLMSNQDLNRKENMYMLSASVYARSWISLSCCIFNTKTNQVYLTTTTELQDPIEASSIRWLLKITIIDAIQKKPPDLRYSTVAKIANDSWPLLKNWNHIQEKSEMSSMYFRIPKKLYRMCINLCQDGKSSSMTT